jgi:hypothetical protein
MLSKIKMIFNVKIMKRKGGTNFSMILSDEHKAKLDEVYRIFVHGKIEGTHKNKHSTKIRYIIEMAYNLYCKKNG